MRLVAIAYGCAVVCAATGAVGAAVAAPEFSTDPFSGAELLAGKTTTESECRALAGAVWVATGRGECIRYYHSAAGRGGSSAGGGGEAAIVFLQSDVASLNARGESKPHDTYVKSTPFAIQNGSANWARNLKLPYLHLGRPGTYGSSGAYAERRTQGEIDIVSAALDAIKAAHRYKRLHLIGFGAGGHTVAALLAQRTDIGCAVLASPLVSLRSWRAEHGRSEDVTGKKSVDPITLVDQIAKRADLRIFVLTDPDDTVISARSQTQYVRRLEQAGLPVKQVFVSAPDPAAHALGREGRNIVAACAKGIASDTILKMYQNKRPDAPPDADDPPLHTAETLKHGVTIDEPECRKLANAVWVRVDDRGFCVRYWMSAAGGMKAEATVFIHGDLGSGRVGEPGLSASSSRVTAGQAQRTAHYWSRVHAAPYFAIGRLGAFGSSGTHADRKKLIEIKVVMAALDALKEAHKFRRFHLVGQSGGGHTVAALLQMRQDIGCAVMTSGAMSHKTSVRDRGLPVTERIRGNYDPIDHVGSMQDRPGQRLFVLSDPEDRFVSFRSQREFVERVRGQGLPIVQITASAGDEDHHGLQSEGLRLAADCAKGLDDQTLIARYQAQAVARR